MKKHFFGILSFLIIACFAQSSFAAGWPANYQGVMLQGFYWNSNNETSWAQLTQQSDELSQYFTLIWVPNSARSSGAPAMGYMPIYWFTNHNSSFGTEKELRTMISTFREKGVGIIEDVVINHRVGSSNWYNFPTETWNGKTYSLTNGAICSTDEMWASGGQGCPYTKGNPDTGDDFDGARDLDHTNANVQAHIKDYCKFLLEDLGYAGFRLDMVKGYGAQYTKMYNQYSKPTYCVGEYFDGSYDNVAAWIDGTDKESAAFDFPFKFAVNDAFASGDLTRLVWKALGTTDQPAGMIHYGYNRYAVTFVENHDTYRDNNKFQGNVVAANAFMLCSPGTPCVFWPHYTANKSAIQKLIDIRNEVGVHNQSAVRVLRSTRTCYMAEVTGTKGKLVVKIGSEQASPDGYTNSQIRASGTDYCVWSTVSNSDNPSGPTYSIYFKNTKNWTTPYIHYWGASESTWPGVAMKHLKDDIWTYDVPSGTTGCLFNAGDGDPTKTSDFTALPDHLYTPSGDTGLYDEDNLPTNPDKPFEIYFDNSESHWNTPYIHYWGGAESTWPGVAMKHLSGDIWVYTVPAETTGCLFNAGDGDPTKTSDFNALPGHIYTTAGDRGVYSGVNNITSDPSDAPARYFNMQGVRVLNPSNGIYIRVINGKAEKVRL